MPAVDPSLAITANNIQKAYIAYFGRPADPEGLMFWMSAAAMPGVTMVNVMDSFARSDEFNSRYPDSGNLYALVNAIYLNLFGHAADSAGANFFVNGLATGQTTIGNVAYEIARGAQGTDLTALNSKLAYASAFTSALQADAAAAAAYDANTLSSVRSVVSGVFTSGDAATATAGIGALVTSMISASVITLTADAPAVLEGNSGSRLLSFTLTLDKAPAQALTLNYESLASGTATPGQDFDAAAGTVTFAAGQRVATVSVSVYGDLAVELSETLHVRFSGTHLAASVTAIGTITNDDNAIGAVTDSNPVANSVVETAATGTAVGITVRAVDPDTGAGVTYRLTSDAGGRFAVDTVTGVVSTAAALDHEAAASHAVTVLATSSDGSTSSQTFTISATDANEAPVFSVPSRQVAIQENTLASVTLLTSTATDGDTGDTRTYSLSGADAALFNINATTGAVTFKASPNFELPLAASGTNAYRFNIVATDAGGLTATQSVIVNVTNVNESFTNASDTILGGDGDDIFSVGNNELGAGDFLNGGAGNDTLAISVDARAVATTPPLSFAGFALTSIERIVVTNDGTGAATFDLSGSGTSTLVSDNSSQTVVFNNAKAGTGNATNLELRNLTNTAGVTLDIRNSDVTGSADRVNLLVTSSDNLGGANVGTIAIDYGLETVSLSTAGSASAVTIATLDTDLGAAGSGARTLEISSAVATTITNALDSFVNTVSGAGSTGALSFSVANASTGTTLTTGSGADNVTGSANNDSISVAGGNNTVVGSGGNDTVTAADGNNTLTTTGGNDSITVGNGNNTINAGDGTNTVLFGGGNNTVITGLNNDTITGSGNGNNTITAGSGDDSVTTLGGADSINAGAGNDTVSAGGGANVIDAGAGNDSITSLDGADVITLGTGNDTVSSGAGDDTIIGAPNFDANFADPLTPLVPLDSISAGTGTDELRINAGSVDESFRFVSSVETLTLQTAGTTVLQGANIVLPLTTSFAQTAGIVTINIDGTYLGNDSVDASTFSRALTVNGGSGNDTVRTGSGDDVFNIGLDHLQNSLSNGDLLNAGDGTDSLNLDASTNVNTTSQFTRFETINLGSGRGEVPPASYVYQLAVDNDNAPSSGPLTINGAGLGAAIDLNADGDILDLGENAETLNVSAAAVTSILTGGYAVSVVGGSAADTIVDGAANDTINAGAGADSITLLAGNNSVMAGAGADTVVLGTGNDNVDAGADADTINVGANLTSADTITGGDGTDSIVTNTGYADAAFLNVRTVEVLSLAAEVSTTLAANAQTAGIVTVQGAAGSEIINASGYTTVGLTINGNGGNDTITGGAGNDSVTTTTGNDSIVANAGNDTVVSGAGNDNISLGAGADVARFSSTQLDGNDTVAGGADADTVELNNATGAVTATVNLTNVTGVETFRLSSSGDRLVGVDADANSLTFAAGTVGTITPVTVDASALTDTDDSFSMTLAAGTSANYQFTIVGSATGDTFEKQNSGANNNVLFAGNGGNDNAIFRGGDLGANITIEGGAGTDTLTQNGGVFIDDDFQNVSSIEVLTAVTALSATLGLQADQIGLSSVTGGAGNDQVVLDAAFGSTTTALSAVLGSGGDDTINAGASNTVMTFVANAAAITAADALTGGRGATDRYLVSTDNGSSDLSGMRGVETITVVETGDASAGLTITDATFTGVAANRITINASDLDDSNNTNTAIGGLTVNAGGVTGTRGFTLTAGNGNDNLTTGAGNDVISLGFGDDTVNSGAGDDVITNLDGNKTVDAGSGNNSVTLGNGDNTVVAGSGNDTFILGNGNNRVSTGSGNNAVTVGNGNNGITGGTGNDTVVAGNGSNSIDLGAGDDTLTVGGTALPLTANTITGGAGADLITLGAGRDFLRVTAVSDSVGLTRDTVTGFTTGTDRIVIETQAVAAGVKATFAGAPVPAGSAYGNNQIGVNFAGNANDFSDAQGAISLTANDGKADYVFQKDTNKLWVDVNDDGVLNGLDIQVTLAGVTAMSAGDVILRDTVAPIFAAVASTVAEDDQSATQTLGGAPLTGNLSAIDTDGGAVTYTSVAGTTLVGSTFTKTGTFGTLVLNATTGAYVYTRNLAAIEALDDGESGTDVFTVAATDDVGLTTTGTYTVTVTGADDPPTLAATVGGTIVETALSTATTTANLTGTLAGADVDGEALTYGLTGGTLDFGGLTISKIGSYGTLTVTIASGAYAYVANAAAVESVAFGAAPTDVFQVTVFDGDGPLISTGYTVTVTGGNDNPTLVVVNAAGAVIEDLNINTGNLLSSGAITFDDVDLTNTHTVAVAAGTDAAGLGGVLTATVNTQATGAAVGSLQWNYSVSNAATQKLAEGRTATQTFTVTVSDNNGGTVSQLVTVTVTGTNDVPTIVVASTDALGAVTEDATNPTLTDTGTITFQDVDVLNTADAHTVTLTAFGGGIGYLGNLVLGAITDTTTVSNTGTVAWTFTVANSAVQQLAAGQVVNQLYTVRFTDNRNAFVEQFVSVLITGTNDAPVVSLVTTDSAGSALTETNAPLAAAGTLTVVDADLTDSVNISRTVVQTGVTAGGVSDAAALAMMTLLPLALPADPGTDHNLGWTFSSGAEAFNYLAAGEVLTLTYTVTATDSQSATGSRPVVITVTGTNDAPVISVVTTDSAAATLPETNAGLATSGTLTVVDLDTANTVTVAVSSVVAGGTVSGAPDNATLLGYLSIPPTVLAADIGAAHNIAWAFSSGTENFNYLAAGEQLTLTYTVTATDSNVPPTTDTRAVIVTVSGTNDLPVITLDAGDSAAEALGETDAGQSVTGTLTVVDLDTSDTVTAVATAVVASGTTSGAPTNAALLAMMSIPPAALAAAPLDVNNIVWTFDSGTEAFNYLSAGEQLTLTYTLTATDSSLTPGSTTREVVITVFGSNDTPLITVATGDSVARSLTETNAGLTAFGTLTVVDPDASDTVTDFVASVIASGQTAGAPADPALLAMMTVPGTVLTANAGEVTNIAWTFDSGAQAFDFLAAGETLTLTYSVLAADNQLPAATDARDIAITITGTNDAPTVSLDLFMTDSTFQLLASDPDLTNPVRLVSPVNGLLYLSNGVTTTIGVQQQAVVTDTDIQVTDGTLRSTVLLTLVQGTSVDDVIAPPLDAGLIFAFDGNDTITGGSRADTISGGDGLDRFVFSAGSGNTTTIIDHLTDFVSGTDTIALGQTVANGGANFIVYDAFGIASLADAIANVQALFVPLAAGAGSQVAYVFDLVNVGDDYLFIDYTNDDVVDQVIQLVGSSTIVFVTDIVA